MKNQDYDRMLSPSPVELIVLLCEIFGGFLWRVARFSPTEFLAKMLGHGFDPDGSRLPEWELKPDRPKITEIDDIEVKGGGFPVGYDGNLIRSEPVTKAQVRAEKDAAAYDELTDAEKEALINYTPPLLNFPLARKIKRHLLEGKSDYEAALLAGCKQSYARHHRLAFQRAAKNT